MAQRVKYSVFVTAEAPVVAVEQCNPWPRNFCRPQCGQKTKIKQTKMQVVVFNSLNQYLLGVGPMYMPFNYYLFIYLFLSFVLCMPFNVFPDDS